MSKKSQQARSQSAVYILIILGFAAVIAYLSNLWFFRVDFTEKREYSISKSTKTVLKNLDDIINIKVYFSKKLPANMKKLETDVRDILSEYQAYGGKNIKVTFEDPATEEAKGKVRALGIPEVQLQTIEKDQAQVINGFMGLAVLYLDKKEVIPVIQNTTNLEYDLTQNILKVYRTSIPKVGIVKTDTSAYIPPRVRQRMGMQGGDNFEDKYKPIYDALQANYQVSTVDLKEGAPIDTSIKTLIVAGGEEAFFSDRTLYEIDQYFMKGGNLIVLVDAVTVSFQYGPQATPVKPRIIDLLEHYGARVESNLVLDASCGQVQVPQRMGNFQMNVPVPYPYFIMVYGKGFNKDNPAVSGLSQMVLPWASPITLLTDSASGRKATPLITSSPKSWTASGSFDLNPQQQWAPPQQMKPSNLMVHLSGSFDSYFKGKMVPPLKDTLADANYKSQYLVDSQRGIAENNPKGNLVIAGDADFLTAQNAAPGNVSFIQNAIDWLSQDDNLISIRTRTVEDRTIRRDMLNKEGSIWPTVIRWVNILLMPVVVAIFGLFIFLKRREKVASANSSTTTPGA